MKLIVCLGNPGKIYRNTRHNAGFLVAEELQKAKLPRDVIVRKSDVFMNESGDFVKRVLSQYPEVTVSGVYVIHDDLDIKLGEYKIQFGKGPKDHNGLNDIYEKLGTDQFWHVRIGVDNRPLDGRPMGVEYVLQNFSDEERMVIGCVVEEACKKLVILLTSTS